MKTYDIRTEQGQLFAFEVSNSFMSRRGVRRVLRSVPNVEIAPTDSDPPRGLLTRRALGVEWQPQQY